MVQDAWNHLRYQAKPATPTKPAPVRNTFPHCRLILLVSGILGGACQEGLSNFANNSLPELVLTEVESYALAPDENVRGGVMAGTQIFFWTPQGAWLTSKDGGRREVRCPLAAKGILGAGRVGDRLLALDTLAQTVMEIGPESCRRLRHARFSGLISATPTDSAWILIQRVEGSVKVLLWRHGIQDLVSELPDRLIPAFPEGNVEWLFTSSIHGGAVLGNYHVPDQWLLLDAEGGMLLSSRIVDSTARSYGRPKGDPAVESVLWHALPPLNVGKAYLRVLADLRSDRRRLLLFTTDGHLARSSELLAPIGFFSSDVATSVLLGIRITDRNDLVKYGWRWQSTLSKGGI